MPGPQKAEFTQRQIQIHVLQIVSRDRNNLIGCCKLQRWHFNLIPCSKMIWLFEVIVALSQVYSVSPFPKSCVWPNLFWLRGFQIICDSDCFIANPTSSRLKQSGKQTLLPPQLNWILSPDCLCPIRVKAFLFAPLLHRCQMHSLWLHVDWSSYLVHRRCSA